jgi:hypothetical protein
MPPVLAEWEGSVLRTTAPGFEPSLSRRDDFAARNRAGKPSLFKGGKGETFLP